MFSTRYSIGSIVAGLLVTGFTLVTPTLLVAQVAKDAPTAEPRLHYQLIIDGEVHRISADKETEIELKKVGTAKVKLVPHDFRVFRYAGMKFRFPTKMIYEADHDDDLYSWSLDGPSAGILIFVYPNDVVTKEDFAELLEDQYEDPFSEKTKIKIGDKEYDAISIRDGESEEEAYVQKVIELETDEGARMLVLGDFLDESGKHSEEYNKMMKVISRDFEAGDSYSTRN